MATTSIRQTVADVLDPSESGNSLGRMVDIVLIVLIATNVLAIILESEPLFHARYKQALFWFEVFSVIIFTVEYLLRVWSCVDSRNAVPKTGSATSIRARYMVTPMALIDLIAIIPSYISLFVGIDLRFLRVIRLLRVFKLTRYSSAMQMLLNVLREEASSFMAAFFILFVLLIVASSGIYVIEHDVQPESFGSIPGAMWWAMATLTTVGYGDVTPITTGGRFFGGCITLVGMGMVALPAGILASAFSDQLHRNRELYSEQLDVALEDGILTEEEKHELRHLQEELGLSEADTQRIEAMLSPSASRKSSTSGRYCPHCGESLGR